MRRGDLPAGVRRRAFLATVATGGLAGLAGCASVLGSGDACDGKGCHIGMDRNAFLPETHEASVGETVVWKNTSSAAHTVTAYEDGLPESATFFASGGFDSEAAARKAWEKRRGGRLNPGDTFEYTFEVAGTYTYFCLPHERAGMVGDVVVSG
jgi:plastocyanin